MTHPTPLDHSLTKPNSGRRDFRGHRIFTIDPTTAKDLDDALHIIDLGGGLVEVGAYAHTCTHVCDGYQSRTHHHTTAHPSLTPWFSFRWACTSRTCRTSCGRAPPWTPRPRAGPPRCVSQPVSLSACMHASSSSCQQQPPPITPHPHPERRQVYLVQKVVPMLPPLLCEQLCRWVEFFITRRVLSIIPPSQPTTPFSPLA